MMMSMVLMMTQMFRNEMKKKSTYRRAVMIENGYTSKYFVGNICRTGVHRLCYTCWIVYLR